MTGLLRRLIYRDDVLCVGCGCACSTGLCSICRQELDACRITAPLCPVCGHPLGEDGSCSLCAGQWPIQCRSVWRHEGIARELVHILKFDGQRCAAGVLGAGLAQQAEGLLQHIGAGGAAAVTWVPMPQSRYRSRAFDHAQALAVQVSEALKLPLVQALARVENGRAIAHQVGASGIQRRANLAGSFAATAAAQGTLLLVDDVLTTGTTLNLASQCLLEHGASRVLAVTATRTLQKSTMDQWR